MNICLIFCVNKVFSLFVFLFKLLCFINSLVNISFT